MEKIDEILFCPSVFTGTICLSQAWILSKVYEPLLNLFGIKTINGIVTVNVVIDKTKYLLNCTYIVDKSGYRINDTRKTKNCTPTTDKVFRTRLKNLEQCIDELRIKPFSESHGLLKTSFRCIGRSGDTCVIVTNPGRDYSLTYLSLAIECFEKSIRVKTISIIDDLIDYTVNPLIEFIVNQCIRTNLDKNKCIEVRNSVDKYFLILLSELIGEGFIKIPSELGINDIINYVKSITKYW